MLFRSRLVETGGVEIVHGEIRRVQSGRLGSLDHRPSRFGVGRETAKVAREATGEEPHRASREIAHRRDLLPADLSRNRPKTMAEEGFRDHRFAAWAKAPAGAGVRRSSS